MSKEEFDRQFDAMFEQAVQNHLPAPDPNPSWDKLERKLGKQAKRRSLFKLVPSVAASFILGAVVFGSPAVTQAFNPLVQTIKNVQTGLVTVIFGKPPINHTVAKTTPPTDGPVNDGVVLKAQSNQHKHYKTLDEANGYFALPPVKIEHIATGFKLSDVMLSFESTEEKAKLAVISYWNASSNKTYMVRLRMLEKNEQLTSSINKNVGTLKEVQINGQPAYLFTTTDGRRSLEYLLRNMFVSISGGLSKEDIMKVGENIK